MGSLTRPAANRLCNTYGSYAVTPSWCWIPPSRSKQQSLSQLLTQPAGEQQRYFFPLIPRCPINHTLPYSKSTTLLPVQIDTDHQKPSLQAKRSACGTSNTWAELQGRQLWISQKAVVSWCKIPKTSSLEMASLLRLLHNILNLKI